MLISTAKISQIIKLHKGICLKRKRKFPMDD